MCPEGAATYAAYKRSLEEGKIDKSDRALLFNCATGLKYPMKAPIGELDRTLPIDYGRFV